DFGVDQLEELSLELPNVLRIEPLAKRRRAGEVGEKDRDDPAFLAVVARLPGAARIVLEGDAAVRAEGRRGRLLESARRPWPLQRGAAHAAETSAARILDSAGCANEVHVATDFISPNCPGDSRQGDPGDAPDRTRDRGRPARGVHRRLLRL